VTVATIADRELLVIADDDATEEEWLDARAEGVTASEARRIASGSRKTWRTVLDDKLNGSTFTGNAHTRRGHEREAHILAQAAKIDGVVALAPSRALFGAHANPLHRATPDGIGIHAELGEFTAEAKSHHENWDGAEIPAAHADQMQWAMYVLDLQWALYVWEVDGVDGIEHRWVPRDDKRIGQLVHEADAFIAWREAGAPEIDDIPDDVDDHLAAYAAAQQDEAAARKRKERAGAQIKLWARGQDSDAGAPLRRNGSRAALFFEPKPEARVLDEEAWAAAEPEGHAEWKAAQAAVAETADAALALYSKPRAVAATFRVTPLGGAE